jgi:hypothetical protein
MRGCLSMLGVWVVLPCTLADVGRLSCIAVYSCRCWASELYCRVHLSMLGVWVVLPCTLADVHRRENLKSHSGNAYYHAVQNVLPSRALSERKNKPWVRTAGARFTYHHDITVFDGPVCLIKCVTAVLNNSQSLSTINRGHELNCCPGDSLTSRHWPQFALLLASWQFTYLNKCSIADCANCRNN